MYKCADCGNIEKFEGYAEEKGNAFIYQDNISKDNYKRYTWIFNISDKSWNSSFRILKCSKCSSGNITKL
ncbi:MAG: hypothetical protein FJW68_03520 [Actinobacteria bacterium]|nr:hypothetical protein [Actinomycetota bacterium]